MLENSTTPDSNGQASPDRPPARKYKLRRWTKGQRDAVESANGHPVPAETEHYGPRWDGDFARNGEKSLLPDMKGPDLLREIRRMTTESGAEWDSRAEVWYAEVTRRCTTISLFENMARVGAETWIVDIARRMYEREAERRGVTWRWTATCEKAVALMVLTHRIGAVGLQSAQVNIAHYLGTSYETMRDRLNPRLEAAGIWDITETRREGQAKGRYKRVRGQYVRTMGSKLIKACGSLAILQGVPGLVFADGRELEPATIKARKNKRRTAIVARRESREDAYQRRNTRSRLSSLSGVVSAPPSPLSVRGVPVPSPRCGGDGRDEDLAPLATPSASPPQMRDVSVRSDAVAPEPASSNPASEGMVGVSPAFEDILRESASTSGFVADFLLRAKRALHLLVFFVSVATAACGFRPQSGAERHTDANSKSDCGRTTARAHRTSCSACAGHRHEAGYSSRGRDRQVRRDRREPGPRSDGLETTHAGRDRRDARRIRGPPTPSEDAMLTISTPDENKRFKIFGRIEPGDNDRNVQFEWAACPECVVNSVQLHANMGAGKRNTNLRVMGISTGTPTPGVTSAHKVPRTLEDGDLAITLRGPSKAKYYEITISATATNWTPPEVPDAKLESTVIDESIVEFDTGETPVGVDRSEDPADA